MKRIIIYLMVILAITRADEIEIKKSNTKYEFGKNVNLIGTWDMITTGAFSNFIFGVQSDKMTAKFAKDGKIYKVENGKEILTDMIFEIKGNGIVEVNKNEQFYNKTNINQTAKKSVYGKAFKEIVKGINKTEFEILSKDTGSCFFVRENLKMCKISGKVYLDSDKKIKIEIN